MNNVPIISAIPTDYNGTTFRSRTEARWAVFLDVLNIPWQFEAEGYQLPSGKYLPDFWLPSIDAFLEVKPSPDHWNDDRFRELADLTKKNVFVTPGGPFLVVDYVSPEYGLAAFLKGGGWDHPYLFCQCTTCKTWGIEFDGRSARICCPCHPLGSSGKEYSGELANEAVSYASTYRFWDPANRNSQHIRESLSRTADHLLNAIDKNGGDE